MNALEQKEVTINGTYYVITAMGATDGMVFMDKLMNGGGKVPAEDMRSVVVKTVKIGGKAFTEKTYDTHFARNYDELSQLFEEVMSFNFEGANPNAGGDTSEEGDTSAE